MSKSQPSSTANASSYNISLVGQRPSMGFTVNSGALTGQVGRQVLITHLQPQTSRGQSPTIPPVIKKVDKILLKAVYKKGNKSDSKTFTIRNLDLSSIKSPADELKYAIRVSLCDDIISC